MYEHSPLHRPPVGGEYYVFRDPTHNLIEIEDETEGQILRRVLQTREVQRLRFIAQNGLARFVYLGLEGSRFAHSLGCYHIARRIIRSLADRQPSVEEGFPESLKITKVDKVAFALAALFHDLGHGPFSHLWEQCLTPPYFERYDHEAVTLQILKSSETEIGALLNKLSLEYPNYPHLKDDVLGFLENRHRLYYLNPLLSGNLDVDRLDFIARDTKNAGVICGFHDMEWIIRSFRFARLKQEVVDADTKLNGPFWVIAIGGRKGLNTLVQFLNARENMYSLVYLHKTVRSSQILFTKIVRRAAESYQRTNNLPVLHGTLKKVLQQCDLTAADKARLDDNDIWSQIKLWASAENQIISFGISRNEC